MILTQIIIFHEGISMIDGNVRSTYKDLYSIDVVSIIIYMIN